MKTVPSQEARRGLRETLRYLNWLYNPFQRLDVVDVYDLLSTRTVTRHGHYLNLGYWRDADDLDDACQDLAMLVGETAGIGPGDVVLDVGFGFGDQDILWLRRLRPTQIIGLNITASQVDIARSRVAAQGIGSEIDLRLGSATAMPLADECVDKVIALECAFHFRTRAAFFREAWRVLRPGGLLVTADIIPTPRVGSWFQRLGHRLSWRLVSSRFAIPDDNVYTMPVYHAELRLAGFGTIRVDSIRDLVYEPLHAYLRRHPETLLRLHAAVRPLARLSLRLDADTVYRGLDYVLASAVKPRTPPGTNL